MKFVLFALFICSVCLSPAFCEDTTVSSTTTTTTLSTTTTTEPATTSTTTTTTTTTVSSTTTTTTTTTTSTTTTPATTTTAAPEIPVYSFRLPKNESVAACFRGNMSLEFEIKYTAEMNGNVSNQTVNLVLNELEGYNGECSESFETLEIDYKSGWSVTFNYTLVTNAYFELNSLNFKYVVDNMTFPNVISSEQGPQHVSLVNQTLFSANKGNSYKCYANTEVNFNDNVTIKISNYQAQPFLPEKTTGFDTAIECSADTTGTSKLVPIIVGSALAILVIMVLVAYIIGRRKHRPGYQQV